MILKVALVSACLTALCVALPAGTTLSGEAELAVLEGDVLQDEHETSDLQLEAKPHTEEELDDDAPRQLDCQQINSAEPHHPFSRLLRAVADHIPDGPYTKPKCLAATQQMTDVPIVHVSVSAVKTLSDGKSRVVVKADCEAARDRLSANGEKIFHAFTKVDPMTGQLQGDKAAVDAANTANRYTISCQLKEQAAAEDDEHVQLLQKMAALQAKAMPRPALRPTGLRRLSNEQKAQLPLYQPTIELLQSTPSSFDEMEHMRSKGIECNSFEIQDQGGCGSCWAFAAARAYSDRLCRATDGKWNTPIAEQDILSCYKEGPFYMASGGRVTGPAGNWVTHDGCQGGNPVTAFISMFKSGVAARWADPYTATGGPTDKCGTHASNAVDFTVQDGQVYKINKGDLAAMKAAIYDGGSVTCAIDVYSDFTGYKGGVYVRGTDEMVGAHAMAMVGYGTEGGVKYWIVANSWGKNWGEGGYGRVRLGTNEIKIEDDVAFLKVDVPTICGSTSCNNGGEILRDCACKCAGLWTGNDCNTCGASCGAHGRPTPDCKCTCDAGYSGPTCDDYVLARWKSVQGYAGVIEFSWKLADYNSGSKFVRFANTIGTEGNPQIGGTAVPISSAQGSVTAQVHTMAYVPGYPKQFIYALELSLGTNEFGTSRGSTIKSFPPLEYDSANKCVKGGFRPTTDVTVCSGAY